MILKTLILVTLLVAGFDAFAEGEGDLNPQPLPPIAEEG